MGKRCEDEEIEKSKSSGKENNNDLKLKKSLKSNNGFSEKDLLTLVQNLQQEININEGNLIKKYFIVIFDTSKYIY